jgi:hypothetical protein
MKESILYIVLSFFFMIGSYLDPDEIGYRVIYIGFAIMSFDKLLGHILLRMS